VAVTGLKGLGNEHGVGVGGGVLDFNEALGQFEFSEAFRHGRIGGRLKKLGD